MTHLITRRWVLAGGGVGVLLALANRSAFEDAPVTPQLAASAPTPLDTTAQDAVDRDLPPLPDFDEYTW
jgi:hypothetical protein